MPTLGKLMYNLKPETQNLLFLMLQTVPHNRINIFEVLASPYFHKKSKFSNISPTTSIITNTGPNTPIGMIEH